MSAHARDNAELKLLKGVETRSQLFARKKGHIGLNVNRQIAKKFTVNRQKRNIFTVNCQMRRSRKLLIKKSQTFIDKCLRKILNIRWPEVISNEELWERTQQSRIEESIKRRKWKWIGHALRKPENNITPRQLVLKFLLLIFSLKL